MLLQAFMIDVGTQEVNAYLMADEETGVGLMVDAGGFDPLIVETAAELGIQVTHILLTHLHWDHIEGLARYLEHWPQARVIAPAPLESVAEVRIVREGDRIEIGPFQFEVLCTAGHTPESVSYYCPSAGVCFVGDALFSGSVGGTSSDEQHAQEIHNLKTRILPLPDATELLPGHGPITTVAIERQANPFLQPGFGHTA